MENLKTEMNELFFLMLGEDICSKADIEEERYGFDDEKVYRVEWFNFCNLPYELEHSTDEVKKEFADQLNDKMLYLSDWCLAEEFGKYGMEFKDNERGKMFFYVRYAG